VATVLLIALVIVIAVNSGEDLPDKMILEVDFRQGVVEHIPDHPLAELRGSRRLGIREQTLALLEAASDDRVVGVIGRIGSARMSLAHVQELGEAVFSIREAGKPTVAFAETIGGLVPANGSYLLATAFEEINLQASGGVGFVGLAVEHPFVKGALDSLGIKASFGKRENYKNSPNLFTEDAFTPDHLEATRSLLSDQFDQLVTGVAKGREVTEADVLGWVNEGPHSAQAAVASGLVDALSYGEEVYGALTARTGDAEKVELDEYASLLEKREGTRVALIYGVGAIGSGRSRYDPLSEALSVGSDTVTDAFKAATDDPDVKAILFRIDSPGGSYVASDAIWHATRLAQAKGIPVVVSMSSAAASGGYLVSTHADRIVAQPGTITGSIGVFAGKFVTRAFWSKLGVQWDEVYFGKHAGLGSSLADFSDEERQRFDAELDRVYDAFVGQVADGRVISRQDAFDRAKGRIWTGRQAQEKGLVDTLGGFPAAVASIREILDLEPEADVSLAIYPKPKDLSERILEGDWEGLSIGSDSGSSVLPILKTVNRLRESISGTMVWTPWLSEVVH
jgi:protease-4